jgi:vitamin B12 transporter
MKTGIFAVRLAACPMAMAMSLSCGAGFAQSKADSTPLPGVLVSATGVQQPLADVLSSVSVITRADILRSQAQSLAEVLQGEAGFEFARNGGPGAVTSFFLRGQDSINTAIVVDGVRAPVDQIGSLLVIDIPLQQIERIEILRGNASALYGDAAVGGVISITTVSGTGATKAAGALTLGARNTRELQVGYAADMDGVRLNLSAGQSASDGFSAMNTQKNTSANPDKDGFSSRFVALSLAKKHTADLSYGLRYQASNSSADYDDAWGVPTDINVFKKDTSNLSAYVRNAWSTDWTSTVQVSVAKLRYEDSQNGVLYTAGDWSYKNGVSTGTQRELRWANDYQWAANTLLHGGLDYFDASYSGQGDNAYEMRKTGRALYAGLTHTVEAWTLQANARADTLTTDKPSAGTAATNTQAINSSLLGLGYRLGGAWRLNASLSTGFRAPTAYEVAATPAVRAEIHRSQELGLVYAHADTYARLAYFDTHTDDAINSDGGWPEKYANVGQVQNKGLEAALKTQLAGNAVSLTLVSQDPQNLSTGQRLARRARNYASLDVSRNVAGLEIGTKMVAADERKNSDYDKVMLPGYTLWSFYASKVLDAGWTLRARIDNAFDRQYELASGYNTPGVGAFVTLQYQPK